GGGGGQRVRVRVSAGEAVCRSAGTEERGTLDRIGAAADVRLACQLRPRDNISVIPLVRTERPVYRATAPQRHAANARSWCCSAIFSTAPSLPAITCRRTCCT